MSATAAHKVPFGQKVAFGLGMLANQMFPAALGIFMVVLVQDMGFPGWMWGILFFLPRVFDSILCCIAPPQTMNSMPPNLPRFFPMRGVSKRVPTGSSSFSILFQVQLRSTVPKKPHAPPARLRDAGTVL